VFSFAGWNLSHIHFTPTRPIVGERRRELAEGFLDRDCSRLPNPYPGGTVDDIPSATPFLSISAEEASWFNSGTVVYPAACATFRYSGAIR